MTVSASVVDAIGNTPLIRLKALSEETGCEILGKAEFMNPGQSVKDRPARQMILEAEARGELKPGGVIVEGTADTEVTGRLIGAVLYAALPANAVTFALLAYVTQRASPTQAAASADIASLRPDSRSVAKRRLAVSRNAGASNGAIRAARASAAAISASAEVPSASTNGAFSVPWNP